MSDVLNVGIVGLGRSGWNIHAAGLAGLPELYRIAAVADPDPERRAEAEQKLGCAAYEQPAELFADPEIDLVTVANPSHAHVATALAALAAGKHVVIEKPVASSTEEVDQLLDAAAEHDRLVAIMHAHHGQSRETTQAVQGRELGFFHQVPCPPPLIKGVGI